MKYPIDVNGLVADFASSRPGLIFDNKDVELVEILVGKVNSAYEQGRRDAKRRSQNEK